jgi:hypothetical protein
MSFALTTTQILNRTKTVTRRIGWANLQPGTLLQAIEKGQGLKKGEKVRKLAVIRVVSVRRERLFEIHPVDLAREGFPEMGRQEFIDMFCASHRVGVGGYWGNQRTRQCGERDEVTRIEFEYVDDGER